MPVAVVVRGAFVYWLRGIKGRLLVFFYILALTSNLLADTLRPLAL
jgi:hypothetical protein